MVWATVAVLKCMFTRLPRSSARLSHGTSAIISAPGFIMVQSRNDS